MDPLLHESINSKSVLENMRNAQKNYNDIYSNLDAALQRPDNTLTVAVGVEIGDKNYTDERNTVLNAGSLGNTLQISNVAQARVAPDLSDLRSGQDLSNRLQSASSGLEHIRGNLNQIASQIKPGEDYSRNTLVQEAVGRIYEIIESTTYAGEPVFSQLTADTQEVSPLEVRQVPELTEKKYAAIQAEIMANAKGVVRDESAPALTRMPETFMLSQSNRDKVFSFPEKTPLQEIADTIADYTADPVIRPLIYLENQGSGEVELVTGEGKGTVDFGGDIRISSLDGELFSRPLDTFSAAKTETINTGSPRIVNTLVSEVNLSEDLDAGRTVGTINLARDNVVNGIDVDNMRNSNHSLSRSEQFNARLGKDRRAGDGFAVTPVDPGGSSGALTAGSELRDSARSANYEQNFDASLPGAVSEVMLLPEEESPPVSVVTGTEDTVSAGITDAPETTTDREIVRPVAAAARAGISPLAQNSTLEGVLEVPSTGDMIVAGGGETSTLRNNPVGGAATQLPGTGREVSTRNGQGISVPTGLGNARNPENITSDEETGRVRLAGNPDSEEEGIAAGVGARRNEVLEGEKSIVGFQNEAGANLSAAGSAIREDMTAVQAGAGALRQSGVVPDITSLQRRSGLDFGTNPVRELQSISGTVPETLQFTLRGERGEMEYVVAAGVRVDTLSLAINTTAGHTGVTANAVNGQLRLAGFSPVEARENPAVEAADMGLAAVNSGTPLSLTADSTLQNSSGGALGDGGGTGAESSPSAVGLSDLNRGISLNNLGLVAGARQNYTVASFAQEDSPQELQDNPQLARQVLSNAYRYLGTLENNLDSLRSLNERNTYEALERVGRKALDGTEPAIGSVGESEAVLNNITVGMNNVVSAGGGGGLGERPGATFNLLSNITDSQIMRDTGVYAGVETENGGTYLQQRLADYQVGFEYAAAAETTKDTAESAAAAGALVSAQEYFEPAEAPVFDRFEESMRQARERVEELRVLNERRDYRSENFQEAVTRAEERYYANIENAKQTLREAGREYEQELYGENLLAEQAVAQLSEQQTVALEVRSAPAADSVIPAEPRRLEPSAEQAMAAIRALQSAVAAGGQGAGALNPPAEESQRVIFPEQPVESGNVMDSLTTREPVAVTSSAMGDMPAPSGVC